MGLQPGFTQSVLANKYRGEPPTLTPPPGAGNNFWRGLAGECPPNRAVKSPLPPGKGAGGWVFSLGLPNLFSLTNIAGKPPPLTPPLEAGNNFWRGLAGECPPNRAVKSPLPPGKGVGGMGLQPGFTQSVLANKYRGETPTLTPPLGAGNNFWRGLAGECPPNRAVKSPFPREGVGGWVFSLGLPNLFSLTNIAGNPHPCPAPGRGTILAWFGGRMPAKPRC